MCFFCLLLTTAFVVCLDLFLSANLNNIFSTVWFFCFVVFFKKTSTQNSFWCFFVCCVCVSVFLYFSVLFCVLVKLLIASVSVRVCFMWYLSIVFVSKNSDIYLLLCGWLQSKLLFSAAMITWLWCFVFVWSFLQTFFFLCFFFKKKCLFKCKFYLYYFSCCLLQWHF